MPEVDFSELARFKVSAGLLSDVREAAAQEGQTMSEFIRGSLRQRLRVIRNNRSDSAAAEVLEA